MEKWYNKTVLEVEEYFQTNTEKGLSSTEINKRLEENGFNELKQAKKKSLFVKFYYTIFPYINLLFGCH